MLKHDSRYQQKQKIYRKNATDQFSPATILAKKYPHKQKLNQIPSDSAFLEDSSDFSKTLTQTQSLNSASCFTVNSSLDAKFDHPTHSSTTQFHTNASLSHSQFLYDSQPSSTTLTSTVSPSCTSPSASLKTASNMYTTCTSSSVYPMSYQATEATSVSDSIDFNPSSQISVSADISEVTSKLAGTNINIYIGNSYLDKKPPIPPKFQTLPNNFATYTPPKVTTVETVSNSTFDLRKSLNQPVPKHLPKSKIKNSKSIISSSHNLAIKRSRSYNRCEKIDPTHFCQNTSNNDNFETQSTNLELQNNSNVILKQYHQKNIIKQTDLKVC